MADCCARRLDGDPAHTTIRLWRYVAEAIQTGQAGIQLQRLLVNPRPQSRQQEPMVPSSPSAERYSPWVTIPRPEHLPPGSLRPLDFVLGGRRAWFDPITVRILHGKIFRCGHCGGTVRRKEAVGKLVVDVADVFLVVDSRLHCGCPGMLNTSLCLPQDYRFQS